MDERRLTELLRDAVADPPPPSFDHRDVSRESDRQRRRRDMVVRASAAGIALLAGGTALSVALWTGQRSADQPNAASSDAAGRNENTAPYELPDKGERLAPQTERGKTQSSPPESPKQGGTSDGEAGPAGPGSTSSRCEQADRELAAALAGELPAAAPHAAAGLPTRFDCLPGEVAVTFQLPDGVITAVLVDGANGYALSPEPGDELEQAVGVTADNRRILLATSDPAGGPAPPFADVLQEWVDRVALGY